MKKISTADLRERQVINLCNGEILGYTCDFEIDAENGCIISLIIPKKKEGAVFAKKEEYIVPWRCIECIGDDTVLVKVLPNELCCFECKKRGFFS